MDGLNGELALAQLSSPVSLSIHASTTPFYSESPALKLPRAPHTAILPVLDVEYFTSALESVPTITLTSNDGIVWAGPGWFEVFKSESTGYTSSGIFEDSSQIVEIENMANVTSSSSDVSNLEPTARTAGKTSSTTSSNRKASRMTSSSKQIPRSVYPVQIAQTEDNALVVEGVGIIETLVSSEISASVATFTAFKTIVVTTVSTSMICTCDNTLSPLSSVILSPTSLTNSSRPTSSAFSGFSPSTVQRSTPSNSTAAISSTQLSAFLSLSSINTAVMPTSSTLFSTSTSPISTIQSPNIPSNSSLSTSTTTSDFQPPVTPINRTPVTVTPFDPPTSTSCNPPPPAAYIDVNAGDMGRYADKFCQTDFPEDCATNGYSMEYPSNFDESQVGYNMSISPITFCTSTFTCKYPVSDSALDCSYSLKTAWHNCTGNLGMGGTINAGCLVYSVTPIAY